MKKRGQADAVKYIIIAAVIIIITLFGYGAITKIREKNCNVELAKFEVDLNNLDKLVKFGSVKEFTQQVPCGIDEIYFFDLSKDIDLDFLKHLPLLRDSVKSKAEKNIFLVKDNEVVSSFYAGNLDIQYPNYICFLPKFEKLNFFVEGKGRAASVFAGCFQPECTYVPVEVEDEKAVSILDESAYFYPGSLVDVDEEFKDFYKTKENVQIFRKYEYCKEDGKTNVEIIIKPDKGVRLKNFRFLESIPKNCIDELDNYLSKTVDGEYEITAPGGEFDIKSDPLIMWTFADIKTEHKFSYLLDTTLTEECRDVIEGLGVAQTCEGCKAVLVPGVDITGIKEKEGEEEIIEENTPPTISISDFLLETKINQNQLAVLDLWQLAEDSETISQELGYSLIQADTDVIECDIENQNQIWCVTKQNIDASTVVTVEVFDGGHTGQGTFTVSVRAIEVNAAPSIMSLPDKDITFNQENQVVVSSLLLYASDYDGDVEETKKEDLEYSIVEQTNRDAINCFIEGDNKRVFCKTKQNRDAFSDITVKVSDGELTVQDTFRVVLNGLVPSNTAPIIADIPDKTITFNQENQLVIPDLWIYASDEETESENLRYSITEQINTEAMDCFIKINKRVWCETKQNIGAFSDITVEVSDNEFLGQYTFRVTVESLVAEDCSDC
tara:strand:+ start:1724 stop:3724 length:2001 start_codon:yes stop_codon:yes gene_type:complete